MSEALEITYRDVEAFGKEGVLMVDLRDEEARNYGIVPYAKWIVPEALEEHLQEFLEYSKVILFDVNGAGSVALAKHLRERGVNAYSLVQGYSGYLLAIMEAEEAAVSFEERLKNIELSIRKKFHKELFTKFAKAINTYEMVAPGDKIAVCISGGKDSMLLAKLFQELKRHNKFEFELVFLVMDPGYSKANRLVIENNARILGIPVTIFTSEIFDAVYDIEKSPCYLCARMRRGYLYSKAKELGCNKIALGHHYDDVIETILMGMLYGGQIQTMMPKLHSTNFEGMELIRPLYFVREADIKHWRDYNGLHFLQCACRFTEQCAMTGTSEHSRSKRQEVKELIATMKKVNPFVEANIFRSVENVNLSTIIAYKKNGVKHPFLETYDDPQEYSEEE
ncbi:MAG: ATPase [Lachnospiraceae bacterium]|nr:ATPase [Lachnospiraceae bacterium]